MARLCGCDGNKTCPQHRQQRQYEIETAQARADYRRREIDSGRVNPRERVVRTAA